MAILCSANIGFPFWNSFPRLSLLHLPRFAITGYGGTTLRIAPILAPSCSSACLVILKPIEGRLTASES
ncbi:hypothetical protein B0I35DRAFT_431548 [Stachybotrys elegans]|uniref:Uncharacterized protein n=1 Tax=Stachybotrys elegans TaxID=80388 RepID=A0A8K0SLP4_9HYPO|nr:hypothetical protein B0I35DRAFT_431548 [Stachybotrys elegans]